MARVFGATVTLYRCMNSTNTLRSTRIYYAFEDESVLKNAVLSGIMSSGMASRNVRLR